MPGDQVMFNLSDRICCTLDPLPGPVSVGRHGGSMLELVIDQRRRDLGGFEVGLVLPFAQRRMIGPFVFFDHMGPIDFPRGIPRSIDVRPHPHIAYRP